ncbi:MAG TPA: polysaccharide biosynthesis/export family protein [Candidatus Saccharimonadales bacterium]|nr:polysaccharide biosynthesis/export family protein [Candidatus Saccharimonadales bacterium]
MSLWNSLRVHPGRAAAGAAVALVLVLLFVPLSYTRTAGYEVRVELPGASLASTPVVQIAQQLKGLLNANAVSVALREGPGGGATLVARVPAGPRAPVQAAADGYARALAGKGVPARAEVRPVVERALGSVCAIAAERLREIRIEARGKTPAQIEQEIRARLAEVGFVNPQVTVTKQGGQMHIEVRADAVGKGAGASQARITVDGTHPGK